MFVMSRIEMKKFQKVLTFGTSCSIIISVAERYSNSTELR